MDIVPTIVASIDIFLFVTFMGIGIYLSYLYKIWREPSIGSWAIGTIFGAISMGFHLLGIFQANLQSPGFEISYRVASLLTFVVAWFFGIAHPIARRHTTDILLIIFLSIPLGFIIPYTFESLEVIEVAGLLFERFTPTFNTYDLLNFLFFGILYVIFARDSHLIYNASIRKQANARRKSIAIGHLFAWQFFAVGSASLRYFAKFAGIPVYFGLPFILLLVPLLTLGSRPFDWAREGHEPILLLLVDHHGTPLYSWTNQHSTPLFLEGSTLATVSSMLRELVGEPVEFFMTQFQNLTLYSHTTSNYLSVLITTGPHHSFYTLQKKIHELLINNVIEKQNIDILGLEFPFKLQWLLSQLLPDPNLQIDSSGLEQLFSQRESFLV